MTVTEAHVPLAFHISSPRPCTPSTVIFRSPFTLIDLIIAVCCLAFNRLSTHLPLTLPAEAEQMSEETCSLKRSHTVNAADGDDTQQPPAVQSLTVRFSQPAETWCSPPTYDGGNDFVWPPGWIEVLRHASTAVSSSLNEQRETTTMRPRQYTCINKYQPPPREDHVASQK